MSVRDLGPELAQKAEVDLDQGVLVVSVTPGGPAARAGVRPGEIIVAVQGKSIPDTNAFLKEMGKHAIKSGISMRVVSKDGSRFVLLKDER